MDPYHLVLLETLHRHRAKIRRPPVLESKNESNDERLWKISDLRRRFEVGLLQILERNLQAADIQSLPSKTAQELRHALCELFKFLNGRANEDFHPGDLATTIARSQFKPSGAYPRLERLLPLLDQYPGPFEISGTTNRCVFTIYSEDHAKTAHTLVRNVTGVLNKPVFKESKEPSLPFTIYSGDHAKTAHTLAQSVTGDLNKPVFRESNEPSLPSTNVQSSTDNAFDRWLQSLDRGYRKLLGKMLDAMKSDFEACESSTCRGTPHEVRIQLLDIGSHDISDPKTTVAVFLLCKPNMWQSVQCKIDRTLQSEILQKPRLCEHLRSSLDDEDGLILLFHEKLDFYRQDSNVLPFNDPKDHRFQTLENLIEIQQAFSLPPYKKSEKKAKFKHQERRALAAKLALHLSIFCPWKHTSTPWDGNSIYFVDLSSNDHNRAAPYISWDVRHDSSTAFKPPQTVNNVTLRRSFTALAKLLLEIEYGRMPDYETLDEENLRRRVKEFYDQWKEHGDLSKKEYLEAIDACLGFHRAYEGARLLGLGRTEEPEDTYRRLIRTNITRKIIADLPEFQPPEEKRARSAPFISDANDSSSDSHWHVADSFDNAEPSVLSESQITWPVPSEATEQEASPSAAIPSNGQLQDDESDSDSLEARRRKTDKWFNNFIELLKIYKTGRAPGPRLKVAILDSGINYSHPDFDGWDIDRIKETMTFIGGNPKADNVGHGTHIAATILRLTENVDLYIGKITESKDVEQRQEVANAIKHARTEWEVDMISLSFGFTYSKDTYSKEGGIGKEISRCINNDKKRILVFASASNNTNEGWRTWPARDPGVICVHSAKHWGGKSDCNPPTEGEYNFSFVGEQLRPAWGRRDLQDPKKTTYTKMKYKSGTSYATPVAVSVAALIIGFINLQGWSNWTWLHDPRTPQGMERIFKLMSTPVDGSPKMYDWVSPTRYFALNRMIDHIKTDFERGLGRQ